MDKVSSILPTSARVKSVDLSEAQPVRPGAPSVGQPEGRTSARDRVTLSADAKERAASETLLGRNPREASRAKMVAEISRKFFDTRLSSRDRANSAKDRMSQMDEPAVATAPTAKPEIDAAVESDAISNIRELDLEA